MTDAQPIVLTLWGKGFDEIIAAAFAGELRRHGARVKTVGLNMQQTMGRHGLALQPDLTLDQALSLVQHTSCVIIPGTIAHLQQFGYDPRLAELLQRAAAVDTIFVVSQSPPPPGVSPSAPQPTLQGALTYLDDQDIGEFVRGMLMPQLTLRSVLP